MFNTDGLTNSGMDLLGAMLQATGLLSYDYEFAMVEARRRHVEMQATVDSMKANYETLVAVEQDKLALAYKGFLQQCSHDIDVLRKKYDVENLKLIRDETFKSLEKAFMMLKTESTNSLLASRHDTTSRERSNC